MCQGLLKPVPELVERDEDSLRCSFDGFRADDLDGSYVLRDEGVYPIDNRHALRIRRECLAGIAMLIVASQSPDLMGALMGCLQKPEVGGTSLLVETVCQRISALARVPQALRNESPHYTHRNAA